MAEDGVVREVMVSGFLLQRSCGGCLVRGMDSEEKDSLGAMGGVEGGGGLPPVGEPVWVQCKGFRTKAFRDKAGVWRTLARQEVLEGVVKVIEETEGLSGRDGSFNN